ncbi:type III pantothenate kinase, partial [Bacteroides sp. OttesenSCG-928-N06]|nr:type III pantothenate kinase [Bacteroides sp. OttesenSCG-928-N06]
MNLVIDIGNTSVKAAVFSGKTLVEVRQQRGNSLLFVSELLAEHPVNQGILASVIALGKENEKWLNEQSVPIMQLNQFTPIPVINLYETPHTLGYDRIAAVVGAYDQFPGKNILVIDAGTAITYEFIDAEGRYHGGN